MSYTRQFVLALVFVTLAPGRNQETPFTIRDNVDLVLLDVSVKDSHSAYVTGLDKSNFRVLEDGKPRGVTQFGNIDTPVTVGLVVDNSGSMRSKRPEILQAGMAFAHESNPHDEFFVVNFNNFVTRGLPADMPFTDSLGDLQRALFYGVPQGQTALYDAISYSLEHLERAHHDQRTLIVVSDGGDNISKTSLSEVMKQIELSRATIYTIGLIDPDNRDLKPGILRKIAAASGGSYFEPHDLDQVLRVFKQISQDIRHRYTVGFVPNETTDHHTVRSVKISAERNGQKLNCKYRSTYRVALPEGNI